MAQQYGLGRGLASLIPPKKKTDQGESEKGSPFDISPLSQSFPIGPMDEKVAQQSEKTTPQNNGVAEIAIGSIVPNPHQPRLHFDEEKLSELAASIQ